MRAIELAESQDDAEHQNAAEMSEQNVLRIQPPGTEDDDVEDEESDGDYDEDNGEEEEEPQEFPLLLFDESTLASRFPCGAHLLQLAANAVNNRKSVKKRISAIRKVAIESKKLAYRHLFNNNINGKVNLPRTDCAPRWDSSYLMLLGFDENRVKYQGFGEPKLHLSPANWDFISEYVQLFKPVHEAMLFFQRTIVTTPDCYLQWLKMELTIKSLPAGNFNLKDPLLAAISRREQSFHDSESFAAALVVDPRIIFRENHPIFNLEMAEKGTNHLVRIHQMLTEARGVVADNNNNNINNTLPLTLALDNPDVMSQHQLFVQGESERFEDDVVAPDAAFRLAVSRFVHRERRELMSNDFNIVNYWHKKRENPAYKELHDVAMVALAAPFTQAKVERDFSGFGLVYTHLRTLISDNLLDSIHIIKGNFDLFEKVNFY
jgi:hypothetical protein